MSPQEPTDRVLDRYLQGGSVLSKIYKSTTADAPPAELDAAVLAKARQAVEAHTRTRAPALRRWMIPASLAAVLILAVGLVTFVFEHGGTPFAPKPVGSKESFEQRQQPVQMLDREMPLQQQQKSKRQPRGGSVNEPIPGKDSETRRSNVTAPASVASPAERPAASTPADAARPKEEAKHEQPRPDKASEADQLAPTRAVAPEDLSPQEWLKRIVELRKQGKLSEAQSSLAEFRRRYPDYPVETILK